MNIVNQTEMRYLEITDIGRKMLKKALNKYGSDTKLLSGEQLWEIQEGRFGKPVPADVISILASDFGIATDMNAFEEILQKHNQETKTVNVTEKTKRTWKLSQHDIEELRNHNIPITDDSHKFKIHHWTTTNGYELSPLQARIVALFTDDGLVQSVSGENARCGLLLDQTCFYAEAGGQACDQGSISVVPLENVNFAASNQHTAPTAVASVYAVQATQQYVVHSATLQNGTISTGDTVVMQVNRDHRVNCMSNHTATHLLNFCLNEVLGGVRQQGSMVDDSRLTFDFTCHKASVSNDDLYQVATMASQIITSNLPVYRVTLPLDRARAIPGIVLLQNEVYPSHVHVVSIGKPVAELLALSSGCESSPPTDGIRRCSVELCGGTHVENVGHLGAVVITHCQGSSQGTKRLTAVTGQLAFQAMEDARMLQELLQKCSADCTANRVSQDLQDQLQTIERTLSEGRLLPKVERDHIQHEVERLIRLSGVSERENETRKSKLQQDLEEVLKVSSNSPVIATLSFSKTRDMVDVLVRLSPSRPLLLLSQSDANKESVLGIAYVPQVCSPGFSAAEWASYICTALSGSHSTPRGKHARHANAVHVFSIGTKDAAKSLCQATELAEKFLLESRQTTAC
jgi:alanyl-tRNA synthetase